MRHGSRTVNDAFAAFDLLEGLGLIDFPRPDNFKPAKFGDRTFGQLEAAENKLTTDGINRVLSGKAKLVFNEDVVSAEPTKSVAPLVFSAVKISESAKRMVFRVKIQRGWTQQQLVGLMNCVKYTSPNAVASMPLGETLGVIEELEYVMFRPGQVTQDAAIATERAQRRLTQDLEIQFLLNAHFPELAEQCPNGDSWLDNAGNWHYGFFSRNVEDGRHLMVLSNSRGWPGAYWFGGRK